MARPGNWRDTNEEIMAEHIRCLHFDGQKEYFKWCKKNGFICSLNKDYRQRTEERKAAGAAYSEYKLKESRKFHKPETLILNFLNNVKFDNFDRVISTDPLPPQASSLKDLIKPGNKKVMSELIHHCLKVSKCLFEKVTRNRTMLNCLVDVAEYSTYFIRDIKSWKPKSHNCERQFSSLLRHLFAKYEVPLFMDQAWTEDTAANLTNRSIYRSWFLHLGTGQNFRSAPNLPVALTKKQAHYFMRAPNEYNILNAIRYGQIVNLGGTVRLSNVLVTTLLGANITSFDRYAKSGQDEFWQSVIKWFIDNPMLDLVHAGPIIDWLNNQKFVTHALIDGVRVVPQPNLSMKKRDVIGTLASVEEWHKRLGREKAGYEYRNWEPCGIKDFEFTEGQNQNVKVWKISEILTANGLTAEGRTMSHCVASYARSCHSGDSSIWSMTCRRVDGTKNELTIQVNNVTKRIVQVRGKFNILPTEQQLNVVNRWANREGLGIARLSGGMW